MLSQCGIVGIIVPPFDDSTAMALKRDRAPPITLAPSKCARQCVHHADQARGLGVYSCAQISCVSLKGSSASSRAILRRLSRLHQGGEACSGIGFVGRKADFVRVSTCDFFLAEAAKANRQPAARSSKRPR